MNIGLDQLDPGVLLLVAPLVLLQLGLLIFAIADLLRDDRAVRWNNKGLWAVIIVLVNVIGPVLYFLVGRVDGPPPAETPAPGAVPGWGSPHDPPVVDAPLTPAGVRGGRGRWRCGSRGCCRPVGAGCACLAPRRRPVRRPRSRSAA